MEGAMIKADLVRKVVESVELPQAKASDAVNAVFDAMRDALATGERIELRGFGVFVVKNRKRGIGRNPKTGVEVAIPPGKAIRFKPGKALRTIR
jgi:DNA-binding protein HU-beta